MARLVVIVLVLVAIAVLANKYLIHGGDPRPADKPAAEAPAAEKSPAAEEEKTPAEEEADDKAAVEETAESAVADAAAGSTVDTDVPAKEAAVAVATAGDKPSGEPVVPGDAGKTLPPETMKLGDPSLTAGIPGDDIRLSKEEITKWLDDVKNHVVLKPELPLGLKAGEAEIKGLDENPLTRAKIELGRQLYFDQRLSVDASISCASCHDPALGYATNTRFGVGVKKKQGSRNSPVAYNRILSGPQFWDGRAPTLEEQAKGPIANPIEMSNTHEACVAGLKKVPGYVLEFNKVFDDGLNIENAARAIASFERALVTGPAPWDYYQELKKFQTAYAADIEDLDALQDEDKELYDEYMAVKKAADDHPLSDSARRGGEIFFSDRGGCTACHLGANFTDEKYHNLGVGMEAEKPDLGRFEISKAEKEKGAFKTPTCRNVALTAPYMHDGSQKTLEEVVNWYAKGGHKNEWLDEKVKVLKLSDEDKKDLVAFMREGLQGELPKVERLKLPADPEIRAENLEENAEAEAAEKG